MHKLFQNSIALVQYFDCPTLVITFTANSYLKEIINKLLSGKTAANCPDLVEHVFHMKDCMISTMAILARLKGESCDEGRKLLLHS
jgi:hypothetical protein